MSMLLWLGLWESMGKLELRGRLMGMRSIGMFFILQEATNIIVHDFMPEELHGDIAEYIYM